MHIAILSRNAGLYSSRRLSEAAALRGHEARILDTLRCYLRINSTRPAVHYNGEDLARFDAVIPRIGASITFYGTAVLRQFEMTGAFPANSAEGINRACDKLGSLQRLMCSGIGLPITVFAHAAEDAHDLIGMAGGAPLVVKLLEGSQGIGVILAETSQSAVSVVEAFMGIRANIMVQEFIKEAHAADVRCFVIDGQVVAAMMRQGKEGEFRSNLHRGGSARQVEITPEEERMALLATRIMGLNIAGVDILRSARGPLVVEVNSSPGLEGIEEATGQDIAALIIEFIERQVFPLQQALQRPILTA